MKSQPHLKKGEKMISKGKILLPVFIALFIGIGFILNLQAAEITFMEGNVQVQSGPQKAWQKASVGMKVNIGDSIQTARSSKADVALDENKENLIRIEENTLVILNSLTPGQINKLDLSHGKIFSNVEKVKKQLSFEISTPSSVAGVRGTGWSVDSNANRDEIASFQDKVYLKTYDAQNNLISEVEIPEGFKSLVERFQAPGALTQLTDEERAYWEELKRQILEHAAGGGDQGALIEDSTGNLEEVKEGIEEQNTEKNIEKREEEVGAS
jgi:hypothetical protein